MKDDDDDVLVGIGERIMEARKDKGISQQSLSDYCGWGNQSRIAHYERGTRIPSLLIAQKISRTLCVNPSWLCFGRGKK
jgi:transcriptional regulator with XRE-family HTH domain